MKPTSKHAAPKQAAGKSRAARSLMAVTAALALTGSASLVALAAAEDPQSSDPDPVATQAAETLGSASWSVVDSDGNALGGTEWVIETEGGGTYVAGIQDCVEDGACEGADQDPAAGSFKVEGLPLGNYVLRQTAAPEGYGFEMLALPLPITADLSDVVLADPVVNSSGSDDQGDEELGSDAFTDEGGELTADSGPGGPVAFITPPNSTNAGPGLGSPAADRVLVRINYAGGDRIYQGGVTPLAGVVFAAYAPNAAGPTGTTSNTATQSWPTLSGSPAEYCTTDANGQCWMSLPTRENVGGSGRGYVVTQIEAPDGWYQVDQVNYGSATAVQGQTPYQFYVPGLTGNTTFSLPASDRPTFGSGNTNNRDSSGVWMSARDNLLVSEACGLNVGALVDLSGSVGSNEAYGYLHNALVGLVAALAGTPSQMAVYTFGDTSPAPNTTGTGGSQITRDNANRGLVTVNGAGWTKPGPGGEFVPGVNPSLAGHVWQIQTAAGSQGTNWDAGFQAISQIAAQLDVVIMLTDGSPTRWGYPTYAGPSSRATMRTLEEGMASANLIKSLGVPVIAVGIGQGVTAAPHNLRAISGELENQDFYRTSWEGLAAALEELASGNCKGTINLHKVSVDAQGNPIEPNPATSNGISFDLASEGLSFVDGDGNPLDPPDSTVMTTGVLNNQNGWAQASYEVPTLGATGSITFRERDSDKFELRYAECSAQGATITYNDDGSITVSGIGSGNPQITCTYDNEYRPLVKVNKQWTVSEVDANGTETGSETYTGASLPADAIAGATGTAALGFDPLAPQLLNPGVDVATPTFAQEYVYDFDAIGDPLEVSESVTGVPAHCVLGAPEFESNSGAAITAENTEDKSFTTAGLERDLNEYTITNTLTCTTGASLVVNKHWTVDGENLPVNTHPSWLEPTPTVDGEDVVWGTTEDGFAAGDTVDVGETGVLVPTGMPGCTLGTSEISGPGIGTEEEPRVTLDLVDGAGSEGGTLAAGANVFDIYNTVTCTQTLKLVKEVAGVPGGLVPAAGLAVPGDWNLSAAGIPDLTEVTSGTQAEVAEGNYTLSEAAIAGRVPANAYLPVGAAPWSCSINGEAGTTAANDTVTVSRGQNVVCTVTNQAAEITVLKNAEDPLVPGDFTVSATAGDGSTLPGLNAVDGSVTAAPGNSFVAKPDQTYVVTEAAKDGTGTYMQRAFERYVVGEACPASPVSQDDACWIEADADEVSVAQGERGIYRFVNFQPEGPDLPMTGGQSAAMYAAIGGLMLAGALGLAAITRRKGDAQRA